MTATVTVVSTTEATSKLATTAKSASELWMVEGSYYDLEEFVARHPGGELPLSQTQGQDITPLFYSHHLNEFPSRVLKKYAVAKPTDGTFIKPHGYSFEENGFFMTLKRRIAALGLENGRKVWDYKRYAYMGGALSMFVVTYACLLLIPMTSAVCAVVGFLNCYSRCWLTGIGHEAIHGRSQNIFTWQLFNMMMLFPSSSWHEEHCTMHHPDTKREGLDPDEVLVPLRFSHRQEWKPFHLLQLPLHFVIGFIAPLPTIIDHHLIRNVQPLKGIVYMFLFHLAPIFFTANPWHWVMFWSSGMATCLTFSMFHVSHINEHTAEAGFKLGVDWGEHQVRNSANFKSTWWALLYITGMLELQIEHHLFPVLSYNNQVQISKVVKETCEEFGLPYFEYSSLFHGIAELVYYLFVLSFPPGFVKTLKGEVVDSPKAKAKVA